ncbi:hypothetical protein TWF694_007015 [Orbilia ellipsospora]|uniref:Protection of telomeres protein 1 n=1 Tax=Orbilia ellipsospora TaxID=2528407 RepID=A0AAV9XLW7_9PEZI
MPLPEGYTTIAAAKPQKTSFVSLIGVVVDFQPPAKSNGADYQATVRICDQSASLIENKFTIRLFRPDPDELPSSIDIGDSIVVFRNIKVGSLRDEPIGMSNKARSTWVICKAEAPPPTTNTNRRKSHINRPERPTIRILDNGPHRVADLDQKTTLLSQQEYDACKDLFEFWSARGGVAGSHGISTEEYQQGHGNKPVRNRKAALMKEFNLDHFYDITCYVQHVWSQSDSCYTITVTDFTENSNFFQIEHDPFGELPERDETYSYAYDAGGLKKKEGKDVKVSKKWFDRPFGRYSIKIAIWDRLAHKGRKDIREGSFLSMKNVRIKRGENGNWEGALSDAKNDVVKRDYFEVLRPDDYRLKSLHARRNELEKTLEKKLREKSTKDQQEAKEKADKKIAEELRRRQENNPQVHCGYVSMATTTIDKILNMRDGTDVDFFNRRYRTECRVVDYRPSFIEDFARPVLNDKEACGLALDQNILDSSGNRRPTPKWYWCFELDVVGKDEQSLITIQVDDAAGRYLLQTQPCDLRADHNHLKLAAFRNEIFRLWGNLEEEKRNRRERLEACENKLEMLLQQYHQGHDPKFLEKMYAKLEDERHQIQGAPILFDARVNNKFFFAMVKEYGEWNEEIGRSERKFILENTSVNRDIVMKEREKTKDKDAEMERRKEFGRAFEAENGISTPQGTGDEMVVD